MRSIKDPFDKTHALKCGIKFFYCDTEWYKVCNKLVDESAKQYVLKKRKEEAIYFMCAELD
jgi:hypothetical protein